MENENRRTNNETATTSKTLKKGKIQKNADTETITADKSDNTTGGNKRYWWNKKDLKYTWTELNNTSKVEPSKTMRGNSTIKLVKMTRRQINNWKQKK